MLAGAAANSRALVGHAECLDGCHHRPHAWPRSASRDLLGDSSFKSAPFLLRHGYRARALPPLKLLSAAPTSTFAVADVGARLWHGAPLETEPHLRPRRAQFPPGGCCCAPPI